MKVKSTHPKWRLTAAWSLLALLALSVAVTHGDEPAEKAEQNPRQVKIRGEVVELGKALSDAYSFDLPEDAKPILAFKSEEGRYFTLIHTRRSEALFDDPRLREKQLIVTGRLFPRSQVLEATSYHSIVNGVVHDLYYYCEVCAIKSISPDLCQCCREPVELVEEPLE